jgi:hypothetical protein
MSCTKRPPPCAKRSLLFSDERPATRPRMSLQAIAASVMTVNPTPAIGGEGRRAAPGTATTVVPVRRLFSDDPPAPCSAAEEDAVAVAGDRGASSSPPCFKATRALFGASPRRIGSWLETMEKVRRSAMPHRYF